MQKYYALFGFFVALFYLPFPVFAWQQATEWQVTTDPADALKDPVYIEVPQTKQPSQKEGNGLEKTSFSACDLSNYQSATLVGPSDFPYTSVASGITVNATTNVTTLPNTTYSCNGNSFATANPAWWLQSTSEQIVLTFSAPVTSFSVVVNGTNQGEIFTFTPNTGTVTLSNYCTIAFTTSGNQLTDIQLTPTGTLITINNAAGATQYTITHNALGSGSRVTLLDCFSSEVIVYMDPVDDVIACGGDMVPAIVFTGASGATYSWTNDNTGIGLAASGTGNITSFMAANVSSQQVATITVTPSVGVDSGAPETFTITVNPKPTLTLGSGTNPSTCGGTNGSIAFTTTNLPNGTYTLSYTGTGSPQNVTVSSNAFTLGGLSAGTYSNFSITNNGCSGTAAGPVTLTDPLFTWYRDMDSDGFGDPLVTQQACTQPSGYVSNNTDCDDNDALEHPGQTWYADTDNDSYSNGTTLVQCLRPSGYKVASELTATSGDCNDGNGAINPAATEICDGIDNNCNSMTDEGVQTTYYFDNDNDGYGDPNTFTMDCSQPPGFVTNDTDCDDEDPLEHPGQTWYADTDNDSYSNGTTLVQCLRPSGYKVASELTATSGDCNDGNGAINPAATEICDGIDNNCNSMTDEGVQNTYYRDLDMDGFGDPAFSQMACSQPSGYVTDNTDCNDNDGTVHTPQLYYVDADEDGYGSTTTAMLCSAIPPTGYSTNNTDCNDNDPSVHTSQLYYVDADLDGYGSTTTATLCSATAPTGYSTNNTDCNDNDPTVHTSLLYYVDADLDGYGSTTTATLCSATAPTGYSTNNTDCNDNDPTVHTSLLYYVDADLDGYGSTTTAMLCSSTAPTGYSTDNTDCNDNDPTVHTSQLYYVDVDQDGYGSTTTATLCSATAPTGYSTNNTDCNDGNGAINPAAIEVCDEIDNNCNSETDEGVQINYYLDLDMDGFGDPNFSQKACTQPEGYVINDIDCDDNDPLEHPGQTWYADVDNDGYSSGTTLTQCLRPVAYKVAGELTATSGDCNDGNAAINPAATEVCDGIDNNCNSMTDEGVQSTYYRDMDMDGFGNPAISQQGCSQPSGYVTNNTDCDDNDALEHPGQTWYADTDNDSYSNGTTLVQCLRPSGYKVASELTATSGDCNDGNAAINPAATEICDGIDNNCNSMTDEGVQNTYYRDLDMDGFGDPVISQQACSQPSGYVTDNTDCDDHDPLEHPGQTWYADTDNDGYSSGGTQTQCLRPVGYKVAGELTATSGDCNDGNAAINPAVTEICDGIDNNCNSMTDEGLQTTYYRDLDMDGYGDPAVSQQSCSQPSGYVTNNTDCDDNDALEHPGQTWYADVDNDGYSSGTTLTQCLRPAGYKVAGELTATSGDCNDANAAVYPGALEVCDGVDNNCNGLTDEAQPVPAPWATTGIGETGNSELNPCPAQMPQFIINATGYSPNVNNDAIQLTYQTLCGNSSISVHIASVSGGGWAGITMRESTATGSKMVALKTQLTNFVRREVRSVTNGPKSIQQIASVPPPSWLRIQRSGNIFSFYTSTNGSAWSLVGTQTIAMNECLLLGIFAESINLNTTTTAAFDNVTVTGSAPIVPLAGVSNLGFEVQESTLTLYPNPTNGQLTIKMDNAPSMLETVLCTVFDTHGKIVMQKEIALSGLTETIDLSSVANGVYWVRIQGDHVNPGIHKVIKADEIRP